MYNVGWKPVVNNFNVPSARIRCLNIINHFHSDRIVLELFNPDNFTDRYDAVIFSKTYTDESIAQAEALKQKGKIVILDMFDNRFFDSDGYGGTAHTEAQLRKMCALADYITTSTNFLKDALLAHMPGRQITPIEDALEETLYTEDYTITERLTAYAAWLRYRLQLQHTAVQKTRLIWFGTSGNERHGTGMADLLKIRGLLEKPAFKDHVILTICSKGKRIYRELFSDWNIPTLYITWHAATFYRVLRLNHIALIPVTVNPLTLYKTNNRVITALHNNLAVIADGIPSYQEFSECIALDNWEEGLRRYIKDPAYRQQCIDKGKIIIQTRYTPEHIADRWRSYLTEILETPKQRFAS